MADTANQKLSRRSRAIWRGVRNILLILTETILLLVLSLYSGMYVLCKGPSPTAARLFVNSVRETSAVGFLANLFFSEEEIQEMGNHSEMAVYEGTDPSLITISAPAIGQQGQLQSPKADEWGLVDEDGDGIIVERVHGGCFQGYMMVVLDPSRVIFASVPESFEEKGYTVAKLADRFDAVAGTNAGGFYDPNGCGNGSIPDTLVVADGEIYYAERGTAGGFVGMDDKHILHVGRFTANEIRGRNIQSGVCFGPVLISNGEPRPGKELESGLNPRTGIGQRADGAMLLMVLEGRQTTSLGATYADMQELFLAYGAVNACNLDGGSSSMMWYQGDYLNTCASMFGIRPIPTAVLVLKEGENSRNG